MSSAELGATPQAIDAATAGQILLDVLSFADAGVWRMPDPLPNPFSQLPASK